jgi:hypothetical protein
MNERKKEGWADRKNRLFAPSVNGVNVNRNRLAGKKFSLARKNEFLSLNELRLGDLIQRSCQVYIQRIH